MFALPCPYDPPTLVPPQNCCFSSGGFFSCVFLSLFVLARLFPSAVWLGWLCLVAAVLGCCVLRPVLSLGLSAGVALLLVLALLPLPSLSLVWSAVWCGCVLAGVLSLARSGLSPCLCFASFLLGVCPPFFLAIAFLKQNTAYSLYLTPKLNGKLSCIL